MTCQSRLRVSDDPKDKPLHPLLGIKHEAYTQSPGHDIRSRVMPNGYCEVVEIVDGYKKKVAEVHRLWNSTHRNRPFSIAVRLGLTAAAVRRILHLNPPDEDGFDGQTWNPEDSI